MFRDDGGLVLQLSRNQREVDRLLEILKETENEKHNKDNTISSLEKYALVLHVVICGESIIINIFVYWLCCFILTSCFIADHETWLFC